MRYAGINKNDMSASPGVAVTLYTQGCPHRCKGCHNPETWDYAGGKEFTYATLLELEQALVANNVKRSLAIMGGEPLCPENLFLVKLVLTELRARNPELQVYLWTGYVYEDLLKNHNSDLKYILDNIDFLIDGPYVEALRDVSLKMRGSSNQRIIDMKDRAPSHN